MNKYIRVIIIFLIAAQLVMSSYYIGKWSYSMLRSYLVYRNTPRVERIFTTAREEYDCSLAIMKYLPQDANILWIPAVSHMVNYYIYPRKIYHIKDFREDETIEIDKDFLSSRKIGYVLFDYGKLFSISDIQIIDSGSKVIITRR